MSSLIIQADSEIILSKLTLMKTCLFYELMIATELNELDFYNAIGYLLKEQKIFFSKNNEAEFTIVLAA
jgi:hypothetical protein